MRISSLTIFLLFFISNSSFSQLLENKYEEPSSTLPEWTQLMYSENPDLGEVIQAYKEYYDKNTFQKNKHTQYYKRWVRSFSRDHNGLHSGTETAPSEIYQNERAYLQKSESLRQQRSPTSSWVGIGPFDFDKEAASRSYAPGAAHVYTVEQSASNPDLIYAGTANAGVWKSTDNGLNWTALTSDRMISSVLSLEIDHTNEDKVYFAAAGDLFKTTDGGSSWNEIGDATFQSLDHSIRDIIMHPDDVNILFLASNNGFYRTTNGGDNWTQIETGIFQEIELHPNDPDIIYTVKQISNRTEFYKSTDNGLSFTIQSNGWPSPGIDDDQQRTEIAVSLDAPDNVYALSTGSANGGSGLYGVYVSTDLGANWTFQCCGPHPAGVPDAATNQNLMGWSDVGDDDGGQYYYDLGFEVSPTNADSIFVAGVNLWVSEDGGSTFTCPAKWSHPDKQNYVHADIHDVGFFGNELWIACDGGIFYSTDAGININRRMNGIEGTDFWGFGAGFYDGEVMVGGTYHNGTLLKDNDVYQGGWLSTQGGDNIRGFVNYGNERKIYHDGGGKILPGDRTVSIGSFPFNKQPNASYIVGQSSNLEFHPSCYNIVYSGRDGDLWKSEDNGTSFELIHSFGGELITSIEVAWSDPDIIYVVQYPDWWGVKKLWKTTDGGDSWTDITPTNFSNHLWAPFDITVDGEDANTLWLVRTPQSSGYNNLNGEKVYKSTDGGSTWTNLTTTTLDGEYITNIEHQRGTDGGVYIGTRRGVYYRNNNLSDWQLFNTDLPVLTFSTQLVPYYKEGKIRNGTNRSVFECEFYEASTPVAQIASSTLSSYCTRDQVQFLDHSNLTDQGATWAWTFEGGNPSTSNQRTPLVSYTTPGFYDVTLTVTDNNGSSTQTIEDYIEVTSECEPDTIPGNAIELSTSNAYALTPGMDMGTTNELTISAWVKPNGFQDDYTGIVIGSDGNTFGLNYRPGNELAYHWPGGQWWWSSGLIVPENEWSHVAIVVNSGSITLYLNGKSATHNISPEAVDMTNTELFIGSYLGWGSRNMDGMIDEVCFWDEAKTQNDIRELRHLTKAPVDDASLIAYYQFNRNEGIITDRVGTKHASLSGAGTRITSTAPVGGGTSTSATVTAGGTVDFTDTDITMVFPNTGTYPDGELWVSRINLAPDENPDEEPVSRSYWVVNNYGNNETFSTLESIEFDKIGAVNNDNQDDPNTLVLYKRSSNAESSTWAFQDKADLATAGSDGSSTFSVDNNITSFSQFIISNNSEAPLPLDWLNFKARLLENNTVHLEWTTTNEVNTRNFVIERSADGSDFSAINNRTATNGTTGIQNYQDIDPAPLTGVSYYRIKQVDQDGTFTYSPTRSITNNALASKIIVYPNPVKQNANLHIDSNLDETLEVYIYSSAGKEVLRSTIEQSGQIAINDLPLGTYFYTVKGNRFLKNGSFILIE